MGLRPELAAGGVRFSLGPESTEADVDFALAQIPAAVAASRPLPVS
jgi:cysteine sulfinate desulfinase/cysteine desulfurase-like protein